jgi:hypothetical protein
MLGLLLRLTPAESNTKRGFGRSIKLWFGIEAAGETQGRCGEASEAGAAQRAAMTAKPLSPSWPSRSDWTQSEIVMEAVRWGLLSALIVPWVVGVSTIGSWFWGIL